MAILRERASAKVNLCLHVCGRRDDGYHLLDSLAAFADVYDTVEVSPAETLTFALAGPFAPALTGDNIVQKAAFALQQRCKVKAGAAITLHKELPVGAGLGGGSADAAAALRLLLRFWRTELPAPDLHALALSLGCDVPACLRSASLYMGGAGEKIEPGPPLAGLHALLVNPGKPLLTASVFAARKGAFSKAMAHPVGFTSPADCIAFLRKVHNDLEETAVSLMPEIAKVTAALESQQGCALARMSGSGATCFGLFLQRSEADAAAGRITAAYPGWWVRAAKLQ